MLTFCPHAPQSAFHVGVSSGHQGPSFFGLVVSEQNLACSQDSLSVDGMGPFETEMESVGMESG